MRSPFAAHPLRLSILLSILGALALLMAGPALAMKLPPGKEITPISGSRGLSAYGASYCPGCGPDGEDEFYSNSDSDSTVLLGRWDESVQSLGSGASQDTTIADDELGGRLDIGLGGSGENDASAGFSATFSVAQVGAYGLVGELIGFVETMQVSLASDLGMIVDISSGFGGNDPGGPFTETFVLEPGRTYTLAASLFGYDFSGFGDGATIEFALVPEPSTALLVGLGLAAIGVRRRLTLRCAD